LNFRPDIQILRGLAVLLVVFYHLEIPGFSRGFLGVDIFFVLSGYLMAKLYDQSTSREFLVRRFRRIVPAYVITIGLATFAVGLIALPTDAQQRFDRLGFDVLALSNLAFFLENSYFDRGAFKPLLNLWSLSIEIQYYLLVPLLLPVLRNSKALLFAVLVISMLAAAILLIISPKISFFLLPGRVWEFLVGTLFAWHVTTEPFYQRRRFLSIALVALISSVLLLPLSPTSSLPWFGHPGVVALLISIITGVILIAPPIKLITYSSWIGLLLTRLGQYSYSIYLVHFPIIVLWNYEGFEGVRLGFRSAGDLLAITALTFLATAIVYRFGERLRSDKNFLRRFFLVAIASAGLSFSGIWINQNKVSEAEEKIFAAWQDRDEYRCGKKFRLLNPFKKICLLQKNQHAVASVLFVGDSHADSLKLSLSTQLDRKAINTYFYVVNDPLIGSEVPYETVLSDALELGVSHVVIHFISGVFQRVDFRDSLTKLADNLRQNQIELMLIAPVPDFSSSVPKAMFEAREGKSSKVIAVSAEDYRMKNKSFFDYTKILPLSASNIFFPHEIFCESGDCLFEKSGYPLYFDDSHLTLSGARLLEPLFDRLADTVFRGRSATR
jgi:peptidoglycan/LPS O-acetylase OafA/YrhL